MTQHVVVGHLVRQKTIECVALGEGESSLLCVLDKVDDILLEFQHPYTISRVVQRVEKFLIRRTIRAWASSWRAP
jgi:hypothetical protein